jgi:dTDP-glucose pyrophosphorylase
MKNHLLVNCFCLKVVILAGGLGTRLSEETDTKPKPNLWHKIFKNLRKKGLIYYGIFVLLIIIN